MDGTDIATRARAKPVQRERAFQGRVSCFLALALPRDAIHFAIPGGDRERTVAPGYIAGTPDMQIVWNGRAHFLELKAEGGRLSPAQVGLHAELLRCGAKVAVIRCFEDVEAACRSWGIPLKARVT